jgi:tungstate transport system permease protein
MLYIIYECRVQFVSTVLTGFGRAIAEVGAVQMVGGNVQFKTRVMTTAIMMQTNKGHFEFAIALGIVLLVIAFLINSLVSRIQESAGLA